MQFVCVCFQMALKRDHIFRGRKRSRRWKIVHLFSHFFKLICSHMRRMLRIVQWQSKVCNTIAEYSRVRATKMKVYGKYERCGRKWHGNQPKWSIVGGIVSQTHRHSHNNAMKKIRNIIPLIGFSVVFWTFWAPEKKAQQNDRLL